MTLDTKGAMEIEIDRDRDRDSDTSDSSGYGNDTDTEFRLLEMDNRLVLPFFIESQVSIPRLGVKADTSPGVFTGSVQKFVGLIPDLCPSHWNLS